MFELLEPTQERLKKPEVFDTPQIDKNTNRRLYRKLDTFQVLLRDGKIRSEHNSAGQRYLAHFQGRQRLDVRVTDYFTISNAGIDMDMLCPPWQYHGESLAFARQNLLDDEARALDAIADFETNPLAREINIIQEIGSWGGYKSRNSSTAWALRLLYGGLERLALLWGYKIKQGGAK